MELRVSKQELNWKVAAQKHATKDEDIKALE
jgi:hypothetical protein